MLSPHFYLVIVLIRATSALITPQTINDHPLLANYIFTPPLFIAQTWGFGFDINQYNASTDELCLDDIAIAQSNACAIPIYDQDFDKKLNEVTVSFAREKSIEEEFGRAPEYDFDKDQECIVNHTPLPVI